MTDYSKLLNRTIKCSCGREHTAPIREVDFGFQEEEIVDICSRFISGKNIMVVGDNHTRELNHKVLEAIKSSGFFRVKYVEFKDEVLIPDERAVGKVLMNTDRGIDGIVSIGSGTVNDINRLIGDRIKVPVITVATAPSMDGYASSGSSMILGGAKKTIKGSTVTAIYANRHVLCSCPFHLIQAGFGDIMGKRTALSDWVLSKHINSEYWCEFTVGLVLESANLCINQADKIASKDPEAIVSLADALVLSGICMALVDDTRPASGSEHLISHYLVMKAIERGQLPPSHGKTVAVGTLISTVLYDYLIRHKSFMQLETWLKIKSDVEKYLPKVSEVKNWMKALHMSVELEDYGIDRDYLREIILKAGYIRERYTIFRLLDALGILEEAADYAVSFFY